MFYSFRPNAPTVGSANAGFARRIPVHPARFTTALPALSTRPSLPLLSDGSWRESFPPDWIRRAEHHRKLCHVSLDRAEPGPDPGRLSLQVRVSAHDAATDPGPLRIEIQLNEFGEVEVDWHHDQADETDYRDVIAALLAIEHDAPDPTETAPWRQPPGSAAASKGGDGGGLTSTMAPPPAANPAATCAVRPTLPAVAEPPPRADSGSVADDPLAPGTRRWLRSLAHHQAANADQRSIAGLSAVSRPQLVALLEPVAGDLRGRLQVQLQRAHWDPDHRRWTDWQPLPWPPGQAVVADDPSLADWSRTDLEWLRQLSDLQGDDPRTAWQLPGKPGGALWLDLLVSGRCAWHDAPEEPLRLAAARAGEAVWQADDEGRQLAALALTPPAPHWLGCEPLWYVDPDRGQCGPVSEGLPAGTLLAWLSGPPLNPEEADTLRHQWSGDPADGRGTPPAGLPPPQHLEVEEIHGVRPMPVLILEHTDPLKASSCAPLPWDTDGGLPLARLELDYSGKRVRPTVAGDYIQYCRDGTVYRIIRDPQGEPAFEDRLHAAGLSPLEQYADLSDLRARCHSAWVFDSGNDAPRWLNLVEQTLPRLDDDGWIIEIADSFPYRVIESDRWFGRLKDDGDGLWFGLECGVVLNDERINLLPALVAWLRDHDPAELRQPAGGGAPEDTVHLQVPESRSWVAFPRHRLLHIVETLTELYDPNPLDPAGKLRVPKLRAAELIGRRRPLRPDKPMPSTTATPAASTDTSGEDNWTLFETPDSEALRGLREQVHGFGGIAASTPDPSFGATLRPYQLDGYRWLQFLRQHDLGGVLADDMGLGKTVQTLCHLATEHRSGRAAGRPSLIVAPTSLLPNWAREAARFAPCLHVLVLSGHDRAGLHALLPQADLVVTSYPLLLRDAEILTEQLFHCAVLDEAQWIKNHRSQAARTAARLRAAHRLCLSGTPVENHLGELWSLFQFLMPGYLGSQEAFRRVYRHPIEEHGDEDRREALARKVAPLMLRRTKDTVARDLPPKTEVVRACELHPSQLDLYESVRMAMDETLRDQISRHGLQASQLLIIEALLKLRQTCCDPRLLKMATATSAGGGSRLPAAIADPSSVPSAKLELLEQMVRDLVAAGRRILIFSQFTSMLGLIEQSLHQLGIPLVSLTGSTRDRGRPVEAFQRGDVPVFLISLKAGGAGLNLTTADVVIHYDPWWNPAAESQATDRAYRIGQTNPVFVYKLIASNTVEERILQLQEKKKILLNGLLGSRTNKSALDRRDLEVLLAPVGSPQAGA